MNIQCKAHVQTNGSSLWLLAAVLVITFLSLAFNLILDLEIPELINTDPTVTTSGSLPIPQAQPVPEPPQVHPARSIQASATPAPAGSQPQPVVQPVPTPPAGE